MCGILGFALTKPIPLVKIFKVLEKLGVHRHLREPKPVGGHGAGIAILKRDRNIVLKNVGKVDGSPALDGSNALSLLQVGEHSFLHFIHKGRTRGLTIWTNSGMK